VQIKQTQVRDERDGQDSVFVQTLRHDMQCEAIEAWLRLLREPICKPERSGEVLYQECLARLCVERRVWSPDSFLPKLESAGLMRWFDRLVMERVIDALCRDGDAVLGCNVSGESAVDDVWWEPVYGRLEREPEVAARLVIEITESAPLDLISGRAFVLRLQHLGCRVAVDDFGKGYGVYTAMAIPRPDIIKLDRTLLLAAQDNPQGVRRLRAMVNLASEYAPQVVVEGVATAEDLQLAMEVGAKWAQGWHFTHERGLASAGAQA
jgi:EAL domain-containing protein (putative c-di-GMP-specific phosphodiesterase class I)